MKAWFLPKMIPGPLLAFGAETRVGWSDLNQRAGEHWRVRVEMQDKVGVEGRSMRAGNDEPVAQVLKSSDQKRIAPKEAVLWLA